MIDIRDAVQKYCDSAYDESLLTELEIALHNRKVLEQTPITKEWLLDHGLRKLKKNTI